ncbi:radical SAM family heme chaperone HemW [Geothermobacter hydrogeniphilus]|uniref:Heme chaperone HemW n=1 Tax=Geothermobacter hydrogeniphilus TaxID=1969733 RepID=A0A1X0XZK3_9BACT|nr:radical SAM family heme chaperone HemW [Geothermobacter hydrogeniphilus]ORJ58294.1 hypothetical protein B5V00_12605 [Geothermobacter hydrogeniphilus]
MSGLYLHIPFCRRKCPYCDFYSRDDCLDQLADYHQLLIRQLQLATAAGWQGPFATVFFGGGTPSLLAPAQLGTILEAVAAGPGLAADAEISVEINPGTLTMNYLEDLRACGVNRLSIGVQSMNDRRLRQLRRLHDVVAVRKVVARARAAGFEQISCDLMFALPGQTPAELATDLERLLELRTEHVSIYGLSLEEGTPWGRDPRPALPEQETYAEMYEQIHHRLTAAGYGHYEISNFARAGAECRHNLGYWRRTACLGLGAGAHSFCSRAWGQRLAVPPDLDSYRSMLTAGIDPMRSLEKFDRRGAMAETAYLGLRTAVGVDVAAFQERFGCSFDTVFNAPLERLAGQLTACDGCRRFGWRQWLIYDRLIREFL